MDGEAMTSGATFPMALVKKDETKIEKEEVIQ